MKVAVLIWGAQAVLSCISLTIQRPWTAVMSRRRYPKQLWSTPLFHETNMVITAGWATFFAVATVSTAVGSTWVPIAFAIASAPLGPISFWAGGRYSDARLARLAS